MAAIDLALFLLACAASPASRALKPVNIVTAYSQTGTPRGIARIKGFETISKPHMGLFIRQPARGIARIKGFETGDVGLLEPLVAEPRGIARIKGFETVCHLNDVACNGGPRAASPASRALKREA